MDSHRRRILRAGGVALVGTLAGCGGRSGSPADADSSGPAEGNDAEGSDPGSPSGSTGRRTTRSTTGPTDAPTVGTRQSFGDGEVTVESVAVRDSVVPRGVEPLGVDAADGGRWVLVRVDTTGVRVAPGAFRLVTDADRYRGRIDVGGLFLDDFGYPYGSDIAADETNGWIAFRVPAPLPTGSARVALDRPDADGVAWRVPDDRVERLRSPKPSYELVALRTPDGVEPGAGFPVAFEVRNTGDRRGVFRAVLYGSLGWPPHFGHRVVERSIAPGEAERLRDRLPEWDHFVEESGAPDAVEVHLDWGAGDRTESVQVTGTAGGG